MRAATTTEEEPNTVLTQAGKPSPARQPDTWVIPTPKATDRPTTELLRGVKPVSYTHLHLFVQLAAGDGLHGLLIVAVGGDALRQSGRPGRVHPLPGLIGDVRQGLADLAEPLVAAGLEDGLSLIHICGPGSRHP